VDLSVLSTGVTVGLCVTIANKNSKMIIPFIFAVILTTAIGFGLFWFYTKDKCPKCRSRDVQYAMDGKHYECCVCGEKW
jgi:hypothetical protein